MTPSLAAPDIGNVRLASIEARGDSRRVARRLAGFNLPNNIFGEFRAWVALALGVVLSPLADAILHVVRLRSQEQMRWIAARPIVAGVAYHHAIRNFLTCDRNPRSAMRQDIFLSKMKAAVTPIISESGPVPAFIGAAAQNFNCEMAGERTKLRARPGANAVNRSFAGLANMASVQAAHGEPPT